MAMIATIFLKSLDSDSPHDLHKVVVLLLDVLKYLIVEIEAKITRI